MPILPSSAYTTIELQLFTAKRKRQNVVWNSKSDWDITKYNLHLIFPNTVRKHFQTIQPRSTGLSLAKGTFIERQNHLVQHLIRQGQIQVTCLEQEAQLQVCLLEAIDTPLL